MATATTKGIKVSVSVYYHNPTPRKRPTEHVFPYRITIENTTIHRIQLLRRHWYIVNGYGQKREVKGIGVVGQQPIIEPGTSYQYTSFCVLATEVGKMFGTYTMQQLTEHRTEVEVKVPEFYMFVPFKLN